MNKFNRTHLKLNCINQFLSILTDQIQNNILFVNFSCFTRKYLCKKNIFVFSMCSLGWLGKYTIY